MMKGTIVNRGSKNVQDIPTTGLERVLVILYTAICTKAIEELVIIHQDRVP